MGLLSRKECSICGDSIGLLTGRKLADGNLCRECRVKLSPFYELTNRDTTADIAAQLEYRKRNLAELDSFRPAVTVGGAGKVFIDPAMEKFTLASEDELQHGNPDLFELRSLRGCGFFAKERIIRGDEDESDRFEYDFFLKLTVDHPFLRSFSYCYNGKSVSSRRNRIREEDIRKIYLGQKDVKKGVAAFLTGVDRRATEQYLEQYAIGQDMLDALNDAAAVCRAGGERPQPAAPAARQQPAAPVYRPLAAPEVNFCSNCGARAEGGAFCPHCGARL